MWSLPFSSFSSYLQNSTSLLLLKSYRNKEEINLQANFEENNNYALNCAIIFFKDFFLMDIFQKYNIKPKE